MLGFSLTGSVIEAQNNAVLVVLNVSGTPTGLSDVVIAGNVGQNLPFTYDDGSGGADGEVCDCDGNVLDECGVCGGNDDCLPWTDLMVVGGDNQITLSWDGLDDRGRDFSLSLDNVDSDGGHPQN